METPFTDLQVYERALKEGSASELYNFDRLVVEIYLENLVHYGILIQEGYYYTFRLLGKQYQSQEIKHECV